MADNASFFDFSNLEVEEGLRQALNQLGEKIDVLYGVRGENNVLTFNPPQPKTENLPENSEDLKLVVSKLNEILQILRNSNIISS